MKTVTIPTDQEFLDKIQKSWDDHFKENPPAPIPDYISRMREESEEEDFYQLLFGTWIDKK
jgi:hypothetical protein